MPDFDPLRLDNQLCFPLYAAARQVIRKYNPVLAEIDLTYTQYIAMMVMWEEDEITAGELGRRLYLDSGTLTPLLKSMEKKNLIRRKRSDSDERVLVVTITGEGRALREKALAVPGKVASCIDLDPEEAAELYRLLHKLL